jgi:hypothetical protein
MLAIQISRQLAITQEMQELAAGARDQHEKNLKGTRRCFSTCR